jgi:hypothetical protein
VNVGVAALVYRLQYVALRCFRVGFGRSYGLVVDSCGVQPRGRHVASCCLGFRSVSLLTCQFPSSISIKVASILPCFKR